MFRTTDDGRYIGFTTLSEKKSVVVATPQDSIASLLHQARWGDSKAYLKLADCYRDGFGVKKDLLGMITMTAIAEDVVVFKQWKTISKNCLTSMNTKLVHVDGKI